MIKHFFIISSQAKNSEKNKVLWKVKRVKP